MWEYSPQNCQNFEFWPQTNLPLRGHSFAQFLRNSQILYASIGSFYVCNVVTFGDKQPSYKHFHAVGAFSLKVSIAPSGETTDRIKKC